MLFKVVMLNKYEKANISFLLFYYYNVFICWIELMILISFLRIMTNLRSDDRNGGLGRSIMCFSHLITIQIVKSIGFLLRFFLAKWC